MTVGSTNALRGVCGGNYLHPSKLLVELAIKIVATSKSERRKIV